MVGNRKAKSTPINYNELPRSVRMRPYYIIMPGMIILIGILLPFIVAILLSFTNASYRLPMDRWKFTGFGNWLPCLRTPNSTTPPSSP
jgi:multiple sugar transport system permease protein